MPRKRYTPKGLETTRRRRHYDRRQRRRHTRHVLHGELTTHTSREDYDMGQTELTADAESLAIVVQAALEGVSAEEGRSHSDENIAAGDRVREAIRRIAPDTTTGNGPNLIVYPAPGGTFRYGRGGNDEAEQELDPRYWQLEVSDGPNVIVHRVENGRWHVGILTEDMPESEHDDEGCPINLNVALNDADLYASGRVCETRSDGQLAATVDGALRELNERAESAYAASSTEDDSAALTSGRRDAIAYVCDAWDDMRENYS